MTLHCIALLRREQGCVVDRSEALLHVPVGRPSAVAVLEPQVGSTQYYFSYCESGFRTGLIGDIIVTASHDGAKELFADVPL